MMKCTSICGFAVWNYIEEDDEPSRLAPFV